MFDTHELIELPVTPSWPFTHLYAAVMDHNTGRVEFFGDPVTAQAAQSNAGVQAAAWLKSMTWKEFDAAYPLQPDTMTPDTEKWENLHKQYGI